MNQREVLNVRAYDSTKVTVTNQDYRKFQLYRFQNDSKTYL